jgi:D-alanine-D-alanine ligase
MPTAKVRVAVLYGGRSGEHEVSLVSAASVIRNLDKSRYDVIPVAIDKGGRWLLHDLNAIKPDAKALPVCKDAPSVVLPAFPASGGAKLAPLSAGQAIKDGRIDVIFPAMHGPLCEDGTIQGLLELADVPYVGCGVLASAVGMDKDVSKRLAQAAGIAVVP